MSPILLLWAHLSSTSGKPENSTNQFSQFIHMYQMFIQAVRQVLLNDSIFYYSITKPLNNNVYIPQITYLKTQIRSIWQVEGKPGFQTETILPKGNAELIFILMKGRLSRPPSIMSHLTRASVLSMFLIHARYNFS